MKIPIKFFFWIFIIFHVSKIHSQVKTTVSLDTVFIKKEPNLIFNYTSKYNKKNFINKGVNYEIYSFTNKNPSDSITLFGIVVEESRIIVLKKKVLLISIKLKIDNKNIKNIEKEFAKIFGPFNPKISISQGDQRELYYNNDKTGFMIDAFYETNLNDGSLDVAYITKEFINLR